MAEQLNTPTIYIQLGTPVIKLYDDTKSLSTPVIRLVEVSGNILESCNVTSPHGREDECARFTISDIEDAYGLREIMAIGTEYTLSFWMKSNVSGYVRTSGEGTFKASSEWQKCVVTFNAEDEDLVLSFDKEGTYYIYHIQLELGNVATDYRPATEDVDEGISTAQKTAEDAQAEAKANEEALKKFVAEDFAEALVAINNQIDKKSETWHQTTDPSLEWTGEAKNHVGDLWHNPNTNESYIYTSSGASDKISEAVGNKLAAPSIALYTWVPSYEIPQQVFDDIDGKAQIFSSQPTHPYYKRDLWVEGVDGDIKVCIENSTEEGFKDAHWVLASKYTDDAELNKFITEKYSKEIPAIKEQLDGKAETWYQTADPSLDWDTEAKRQLHVGDMWLNPNTKESYIYTASGPNAEPTPVEGQLDTPHIVLYSWEPTFEIPKSVFDDIDGKAQIFTSKPINEAYYFNDLWVEGSKGDIWVCISDRDPEKGFQEDDWVKASKYTDDTLATEVKVTVDGLTITDEDGTTLIDGGLIKTGSIVALGKVTAGEFDLGSGKFKVSEDGTLEASGAKISGEIDATNLTLGEKVQIDYSKLKNTPSIPSSIADLDPNSNVLYKSDVTVSEETTENGIKTETVTVGGKEFKVIKNDDFVLLGKPYGVESVDGKLAKPLISLVDDDAETYTYISKDGLLIGRNALIYGTIYANAGEFRGHLKAKSLKLESGADVDFLKFDPDSGEGLIIGDMTGDELGNNVLIDGEGKKVVIRDGETELASFGETAIIGKADSNNVYIDENGMDIRDGEDTVASFRKSRIALLNGAADMRVSSYSDGTDYFTLRSDDLMFMGDEVARLTAESDTATEWAEFCAENSASPSSRKTVARIMATTPLIADDAVGEGEQGYGEARIELVSDFETKPSMTLYIIDGRLGYTPQTRIFLSPYEIAISGPKILIDGNVSFSNTSQASVVGLLGYTPSYIQVRTTADQTDWSTAYEYFYPFCADAAPSIYSNNKGNLTLDTETVIFGDRKDGVNAYGVRIGANIHTVRVHTNVYFSSESESPTLVAATIYRWRNGTVYAYSQAYTHVDYNNGSGGSCCPSAIIAVQEGDFIFVGGWKSTASRVIHTKAGSGRTNMIVEAIG